MQLKFSCYVINLVYRIRNTYFDWSSIYQLLFFLKTIRSGVSAGKRDQIGIFFKKKFLSKIDVDLIIWFRTFVISKKNFLSIWSLFSALTPYHQKISYD